MGYYQVYDLTNFQIGMASSQFILNNSFSYNNTLVMVEPSGPSDSIRGNSNENDDSIIGLSKEDFLIMIIVVCGGGGLLIISFVVCFCCYLKKSMNNRKKNTANSRNNTNANNNNPQDDNAANASPSSVHIQVKDGYHH